MAENFSLTPHSNVVVKAKKPISLVDSRFSACAFDVARTQPPANPSMFAAERLTHRQELPRGEPYGGACAELRKICIIDVDAINRTVAKIPGKPPDCGVDRRLVVSDNSPTSAVGFKTVKETMRHFRHFRE
jgi:hypothetical protein